MKDYTTKEYRLRQARNSLYRRILKEKATSQEQKVARWLEERGVRFLFQKGFLKPFHRIVDFYFPKRKIILEVDGPYHAAIIRKDLHKDRVWEERGFKTVRVTNDEVDENIDVALGPFLSVYHQNHKIAK